MILSVWHGCAPALFVDGGHVSPPAEHSASAHPAHRAAGLRAGAQRPVGGHHRPRRPHRGAHLPGRPDPLSGRAAAGAGVAGPAPRAPDLPGRHHPHQRGDAAVAAGSAAELHLLARPGPLEAHAADPPAGRPVPLAAHPAQALHAPALRLRGDLHHRRAGQPHHPHAGPAHGRGRGPGRLVLLRSRRGRRRGLALPAGGALLAGLEDPQPGRGRVGPPAGPVPGAGAAPARGAAEPGALRLHPGSPAAWLYQQAQRGRLRRPVPPLRGARGDTGLRPHAVHRHQSG